MFFCQDTRQAGRSQVFHVKLIQTV